MLKYMVRKKNKQLIISSRKKDYIFNLDDISCFTIELKSRYKQSFMAFNIGNGPFILYSNDIKKISYGNLIIGFKEYVEITKIKNNKKKIVSKYNYTKIKKILNIKEIAKKLSSTYKIPFESVPVKKVTKYYNDEVYYNCFVSIDI